MKIRDFKYVSANNLCGRSLSIEFDVIIAINFRRAFFFFSANLIFLHSTCYVLSSFQCSVCFDDFFVYFGGFLEFQSNPEIQNGRCLAIMTYDVIFCRFGPQRKYHLDMPQDEGLDRVSRKYAVLTNT